MHGYARLLCNAAYLHDVLVEILSKPLFSFRTHAFKDLPILCNMLREVGHRHPCPKEAFLLGSCLCGEIPLQQLFNKFIVHS